MSSQLCRSVAKLAPTSLLLPQRAATNKILTQSLALASSARGTPVSASGCKLLALGANRGVKPGEFKVQCALISTSNKKEDGTSIAAEVPSTTAERAETTTTTPRRTWTSFGFDFESEEADRSNANMVFFFTVTLCLTFTGFLMAYWPDIKFKDWSQREAYIELARREALGLPHIDPDLIPVEKFELPTEEELGDYNIII